MPLCFRYNDTTYELPAFTSNVAPICLHVVKNGTTYYVPTDAGLSNIVVDNYKYFYNSSKPTIHVVSGAGSLGNCFNDSEQVITYDIPAGTYTPSAFESMISQFIGSNNKRQVQYAFQATVNGQTVTCTANSYIAYQQSSSPYQSVPHAVYFNYTGGTGSTLKNSAPQFHYNSSNGFTNGKCYVTSFTQYNTSYSYDYYSFQHYANYSIRIDSGIKFV